MIVVSVIGVVVMLNAFKLIYIFPDVSYTAELLPAKKSGTFTIQSFHQINGQFVNQEGFILKNIDKLFAKLAKENYQLILPDFLFTNTIVNVQETEDVRIAGYIKNNLLTNLGISLQSHLIETTILTTVNGVTKVQLSAIEKSLLAPIKVFAKKHQLNISVVSPLTWTLKSVISLEPSISLVQLGSAVYSGLHYIGVDQTNMAQLDDLEVMEETIKTLKGSEPNIQTIYLISNSLLENKLKEVLSTTLPIQQLVTDRSEQSKIPSAVQYAIEVAAKTLTVADYPVPKFTLAQPTEEEEKSVYDETKSTEKQTTQVEMATKETIKKTADKQSNSAVITTNQTSVKKLALAAVTSDKQDRQKKTEPITPETKMNKPTNPEAKTKQQDDITLKQTPSIEKRTQENKETTSKEIDLSQFAFNQNKIEEDKPLAKTASNITKNKKGASKMIKMIFITIAVFFATIAIGAGIGFGLLTLTNKSNQSVKQAQVTPTVAVTPTETPSPTPALKTDNLAVLVVNATKKSGYAGKIKKKIVAAGETDKNLLFKLVAAANAKGKYKTTEKGSQLLLMKEKNDNLKARLEKATGLKLTYAKGIKTEDATGKYAAVIVLVN